MDRSSCTKPVYALLYLLLGLLYSLTAHAQSGFSVSSEAPEGFEDLAGPQTTLIDVIYAKRIIASTMATFQSGLVTFDMPQELLEAIPDIKPDPAIEALIENPFEAHSEQLCYSDFQSDCGVLTPDVMAIIFDETNFRAYLFINPNYLETNYLADSPFLPPSSSQAATVHGLSFSATGDASTGGLINLSGRSLFSIKESRLQSNYDLDSEQGLTIDTLSLKHDGRGWDVEAGTFRSRVQSTAFLSEQNLWGARVSTSLNTRTNLDNAGATPLLVFLSQRSRVDIFRGSQLVDSRFYGAGNHQLDTHRLPDGAYNVNVKITDESGDTREELFYFARTSALPPADQPLYFAEAGKLAEARLSTLPRMVDGLWVRAGAARRIRDDFGLEATISRVGDHSLVELGALWIAPGFQVQGTVLAGDSTGVGIRSLWHKDFFTLSADIRRVKSDQALSVDTIDLLPGTYTQANFTASIPLFSGRFLSRARYDQRSSGDAFTSFGFSYLRDLRRYEQSVLSLNVDTNFSSDDSIVRLGVDWRWRKDKRDALVRPRLQYTTASNSSGSFDLPLSARINQRHSINESTKLRSGAFIESTAENRSIGARIDAESSRGTANLELQYGFGGEREGFAYSSNARFGLVSSGKQVAFGGRRGNASSVIIEIDGNAPEADFEIFVDRQSYGYAKPGERTIVSLPPYASYDIRLESRGKEFVEFDEIARHVTLYPGNVETLKFTANKQTVIVGQAFHPNGDVLANYRFDGLGGIASTDENGWFQIELTDLSPVKLMAKGKPDCTIEFPEFDPEESLLVFDQLECK